MPELPFIAALVILKDRLITYAQ
ncbi:MAG: hypothetical protein HW378_1093, partial [Anaerolineales bacterium]|nr:hypothetical protein [Anaerolineales bacterium]